MSKRFTDSDKWEDPWYMDLTPEEKLAYEYILDKCSNIGIWKPNFRLAAFCIGIDFDFDSFKEKLGNDRVRLLANNDWWLIKYIDFQYGKLSEESKSKPIMSYVKELKKQSLWVPYRKGIGTLSHTLKEKDKDKEKDKEPKVIEEFEEDGPATPEQKRKMREETSELFK